MTSSHFHSSHSHLAHPLDSVFLLSRPLALHFVVDAIDTSGDCCQDRTVEGVVTVQ